MDSNISASASSAGGTSSTSSALAAPSAEALRRIRSDLKSLNRDPLPGIYCVQDDEIQTKFHALIIGPFDTPYEGGFFYFELNFPPDYPSQPPKVTLMTTGGGTVRFNPNLYSNGKVCLSILGTWSGPGWSPVQNLSSVLISIQSLMNEQPYHNEPGFEQPNALDSQNYNDCIRHETIRVAVLGMISDENNRMPVQLREVMMSLLPDFIDSYELACTSNLSKDGLQMIDPFRDSGRGKFTYASMLQTLVELKASLGLLDSNTAEDDDGSHEEKERKDIPS